MPVKEGLEELLRSEKISATQMAKKLGLSHTAISNVVNGRNLPGGKLIEAIRTAYPELRLDWLFDQEGDMYDANKQLDIKHYGHAGYAIEVRGLTEDEVHRMPFYHENSVAVVVKGDSMEPTLRDGDTLLCIKMDNKTEVLRDEIYVIVTINDGNYIKRLKYLSEDRKLLFISDNQKYDVDSRNLDEIREVWKVISISKQIIR